MEFKQISGVTSSKDNQLQTSFQKLGVKITSSVATTWERILVQIDLISSNGDGDKVFVPQMRLIDLFRFAAANEGIFRSSTLILEGNIELGINGALNLRDGQYLSLSFDGLLTTDTVRTFGMDVRETTKNYLKYEYLVVQAQGAQQSFNVAEKAVIGLPVADIKDIVLQYPNKSIKYVQEELIIMANDGNDIVRITTQTQTDTDGAALPATTVYGYDELFILDITGVISLTVTPIDDDGFKMIVVTPKAVV